MNKEIFPLILALTCLAAGSASAQGVDFDQGGLSIRDVLQGAAEQALSMPTVAAKSEEAAASVDPAQLAPIQVPLLPAMGSKQYMKLRKQWEKPFHDAFVEAVHRLRVPECGQFYGAGAEQKFTSAEYSFQALGAPHVKPDGSVSVIGASTHADPPPASIFINSQGPFLTQSMLVIGKEGFQTVDMRTGLRGADFGSLLLLHELGHVVGLFGPDADNSELNRSYTQQVQDHCFTKEVDKAVKGLK